MQDRRLEPDVLRLMTRSLDSLTRRLDSDGNFKEEDTKLVQDQCTWIKKLMRLFPQISRYNRFLSSLSEVNELPTDKKIAKFVFYILSTFYRDIFSPEALKPAQGK